MKSDETRRRRRVGGACLLICLGLLLGAPAAEAATAPTIVEAWSSQVGSSSARLQTRINPNGASTSYHVNYLPRASYEANVAAGREGFAGAARVPLVTDFNVGGGTNPVTSGQTAFSLAPETTYVYRVVAHNSQGTVETGAPLSFTTFAIGTGVALPDGRGWEQVSPIEKNGGAIAAPGSLPAGGVFQAAADGGSVAYSSTASFGTNGQGAPPVSQYLAAREAGGWSTANLSTPLFSGSYDFTTSGDPFQLLSGDLTQALIVNGNHCRGGAEGCGVANPPLPGTDAPAGYQNFYLRNLASGTTTALLGTANASFLGLEPAAFSLAFAGASASLEHVVVSTCAALTANATEAAAGEGCDPAQQNLYASAPGGGLTLVNRKPGQSTGTPGAVLGAQSGAISENGGRVYWSEGGTLYLDQGGASAEVEAGAVFQAASTDGSVAFFTKGGHLYRYLSGSGTKTDLTPAGGVEGVLGSSADGSYVYYAASGALFARIGETTRTVAAGADPGDYPPASGTARVSADGTELVFMSKASLTGYDNKDQVTGEPDEQVYLYGAAGNGNLACVSCNPTNERPIGPSSIPGALPDGSGSTAVDVYKPRVLLNGGARVIFDSEDSLTLTDTDNAGDVYEWEAPGQGTCGAAPSCIALLSGGRSAGARRSSTPRPAATTSSSSPTHRWWRTIPAPSTSTTPGSAAASQSQGNRSPARETPASRCRPRPSIRPSPPSCQARATRPSKSPTPVTARSACTKSRASARRRRVASTASTAKAKRTAKARSAGTARRPAKKRARVVNRETGDGGCARSAVRPGRARRHRRCRCADRGTDLGNQCPGRLGAPGRHRRTARAGDGLLLRIRD